MASSLTQRIASALGPDATATQVESVYAELGARELAIRARIAEIDAGWTAGQIENTPAQQRTLSLEHEALEAELQQLAVQYDPLLSSKSQAERREAPAHAGRLLKGVDGKLAAAEAAKAAWTKARDDLNQHAGLLAHHRQLARPTATKAITEDTFTRLTSVLDWLPGETLTPSNLHHRVLVSQVANQRMLHLDENLEQSLPRAWRQAGFTGSAPVFGIYSEPAGAEPRAQSRRREPSGYLDSPRVPDAA